MLQPTSSSSSQAPSAVPANQPSITSRERVQDIRIETGEPRTPEAQPALTQALEKADAKFDAATSHLPAWTFPAAGGLLIFIGAALLARGILAKRQALAELDPRARALLALGGKLSPNAHPGDALGALALEKLRTRHE